MTEKNDTSRQSISGKGGKELAISILERIKRIIERMNADNTEILEVSKLSNIKDIVADIMKEYETILASIDESMSSDGLEIPSPEKYEKSTKALDHLLQDIPETDPNDLKSVLLNAIKENEDLQNLLRLMESEYKVLAVGKILGQVLEHLERAKTRLEALYEELINRDYW